jgi:hypothetical protein
MCGSNLVSVDLFLCGRGQASIGCSGENAFGECSPDTHPSSNTAAGLCWCGDFVAIVSDWEVKKMIEQCETKLGKEREERNWKEGKHDS